MQNKSNVDEVHADAKMNRVGKQIPSSDMILLFIMMKAMNQN